MFGIVEEIVRVEDLYPLLAVRWFRPTRNATVHALADELAGITFQSVRLPLAHLQADMWVSIEHVLRSRCIFVAGCDAALILV